MVQDFDRTLVRAQAIAAEHSDRVRWEEVIPYSRTKFVALARSLVSGWAERDIESLFLPFDGHRTPSEQAKLFLKRPRVTNARPWQSPHNWGCAVDFVAFTADGWSWDANEDWDGLGSYAAAHGLTQPIKWDRPHIEDPGAWTIIRPLAGLR